MGASRAAARTRESLHVIAPGRIEPSQDGGAGLVRLADLEFELPEALIAQRPVANRDACRLLVVQRGATDPTARREIVFRDCVELLRPGDVLVRNVTRVLPARLVAIKESAGAARCEILLLEPAAGEAWWALVRPARRLRSGQI